MPRTPGIFSVDWFCFSLSCEIAQLGFTSPTQAAITRDLNFTIAQFSTFGSILNVGCMFGAIVSGRLADYFGRKLVSYSLLRFFWLALCSLV